MSVPCGTQIVQSATDGRGYVRGTPYSNSAAHFFNLSSPLSAKTRPRPLLYHPCSTAGSTSAALVLHLYLSAGFSYDKIMHRLNCSTWNIARLCYLVPRGSMAAPKPAATR